MKRCPESSWRNRPGSGQWPQWRLRDGEPVLDSAAGRRVVWGPRGHPRWGDLPGGLAGLGVWSHSRLRRFPPKDTKQSAEGKGARGTGLGLPAPSRRASGRACNVPPAGEAPQGPGPQVVLRGHAGTCRNPRHSAGEQAVRTDPRVHSRSRRSEPLTRDGVPGAPLGIRAPGSQQGPAWPACLRKEGGLGPRCGRFSVHT